jgi:BlaI family transcriptional regulator, penicillinase repressor
MARPPLSKSELEIAQIVWRLGEARVRDVVAALSQDREVDFWTVQTYLRRLKAKGYLRARREGRSNIYSPAVRPTSVVREVVQDFVSRLFDGEPLSLIQHLIEDRPFSDEEISALEDTLDKLKKRRK